MKLDKRAVFQENNSKSSTREFVASNSLFLKTAEKNNLISGKDRSNLIGYRFINKNTAVRIPGMKINSLQGCYKFLKTCSDSVRGLRKYLCRKRTEKRVLVSQLRNWSSVFTCNLLEVGNWCYKSLWVYYCLLTRLLALIDRRWPAKWVNQSALDFISMYTLPIQRHIWFQLSQVNIN